MITKDKTEDRLVASIRRTKAGATKTETAQGDEKKPAPRRPAAPRKPGGPARARPAAQRSQSGDAYQSGGRVWPD